MSLKLDSDIGLFFHCKNCADGVPEDVEPAKWAMLNVGWTKKGLQVICVRCNKNVINLDFKGQKVHEI